MIALPVPPKTPRVLITYVVVGKDLFTVSFNDRREVTLPVEWFPRLEDGTASERNNWWLVGGGVAIYWPDFDENLTVDGILTGRRSVEDPKAFKEWKEKRAKKATKRKPKYVQ